MNRLITYIWLLLILLATASYQIGNFGLMNKAVMSILAIITLIKGGIVANYFMDLRSAYWVWKASIFLYLTIVVGLTAIAYTVGH